MKIIEIKENEYGVWKIERDTETNTTIMAIDVWWSFDERELASHK